MNLNECIKEIHSLAREKGWWDEPRTIGEVCALICSEWAEALEEYRSGKPAHYYDKKPDCDECMHDGEDKPECEEQLCEKGYKPEGMAVELADGIIRILDYYGYRKWVFDCIDWEDLERDPGDEDIMKEFGDTIANLNYAVSQASRVYRMKNGEVHSNEDESKQKMWLFSAMGIAYTTIKQLGCDPLKIIEEKHNFNRGREWKHGGKRL